MTEPALINSILLAASRIPGVRVWRANAGTAWAKTSTGMRPIRMNVPGCPDIIGWVTIKGQAVFLGIEAKTGNLQLSEQQKSFQRVLTNYGGLYTVARSAEDAVTFIQNARSSA